MQELNVIKIGGNVIDDAAKRDRFLTELSEIPGKKILVHGGGRSATDLAGKLGLSQAMVNGRRITDAETLKVAVMVYAGLINKQIIAKLQSLGINALGVSGADLDLIRSCRRAVTDIDYGFVGDVDENAVNVTALSRLLEINVLPVFCSVTHDGSGQLLNTNADSVAFSIAAGMTKNYAVRLLYCFEKNGVLTNAEDSSSVLSSLSRTDYRQLVREGVISKGMIPKLDNAFAALDKGVERVRIGHSDELFKMIGNENIGTNIIA